MQLAQQALAQTVHEAPPQAATPQHAPTHPGLLDPLTGREQDILRLIAAGQSNREIAEALVMTVSTVKWYTSQIYSKLDVRNWIQALVRVQEWHLLD
jgi:DNA-binding NarL/FixJ family response regulator